MIFYKFKQGLSTARLFLFPFFILNHQDVIIEYPRDKSSIVREVYNTDIEHGANKQNKFGLMYSENKDPHQDYVKAVKLLQQAAEQGNTNAQFLLGKRYSEGNGVHQDYAKAIELFQQAAEQGNTNAQIRLGLMYSEGEGIRQNHAKAKEWMGRACDGGSQDGCYFYDLLN